MNRPSSSPRLRGLLSLFTTGLTLALTGLSCAPQPPQPPQSTSAAAGANPEQQQSACLDIRAALVKCKDGETMTHEGCPEPAYMQRCAGKLPAAQ